MSSSWEMLRAVAATLSPRSRAAIVHSRPKPREVPVMNHVFGVMKNPTLRTSGAFPGQLGATARYRTTLPPNLAASVWAGGWPLTSQMAVTGSRKAASPSLMWYLGSHTLPVTLNQTWESTAPSSAHGSGLVVCWPATDGEDPA